MPRARNTGRAGVGGATRVHGRQATAQPQQVQAKSPPRL